MIYIVYVSGEFKQLPKDELKNILISHQTNFKVLYSLGRSIVIETDKEIPLIAGYILEISEFLAIGKNEKEIIDNASTVEFNFNGSFVVRSKKVSKDVIKKSVSLEKIIGEIIYSKSKQPVKLKGSDEMFRLYVSNEGYALGRLLYKKPSWYKRSPERRPYFHPSSLEPKFARSLVNLSHCTKSSVFLDPFVGTGGIVLEACLLGAQCHGVDIEEEMVDGCKENLDFFNQSAKLHLGDARNLDNIFEKNSIDAIATDPPYGRSTKLRGKILSDLIKDVLFAAKTVLKPGKRIVIVMPQHINNVLLAQEVGFKLCGSYRNRVHRSLTRVVSVMEK